MEIKHTFGEKVEGKAYYNREGAYLICLRDGKVGVVKTPKGYFLLGGGLDAGEEHVSCIEREVLEEAGYQCHVKSYVTSAEEYWVHEELGYFHPIQHYYYGELTEQLQESIEEDHDLEWISTEKIEERMKVKAQGFAIKYFLEHKVDK